MLSSKKEKINLVGSGLVGSLLSLFLSRRGYEVEVFERRSDMRKENISAGRSINLALSVRGIHALHQMGLEKEILDLAIPMVGRMVHSLNGETNLQRYGRNDSEYINSISRGDLNKILMTRAEETGRVKIHFNKNIKDSSEVPSGVIIGTDGSASAIRQEIAEKTKSEVGESLLSHGYKELIIPAGPGGSFQLEKNALHIWPRGYFMLIALPNLDGSFTATLFLPMEGKNSFEELQTPKSVLDFFNLQFCDVVPLFPQLAEEYFNHPIGRMITIKARRWSYKDKMLLVGDAAHAIVPFFGQGMNCGFEDCSVLDQVLDQHNGQWEKIFAEFFNLRKINSDAIADMAVENFIEMRDKVAQPQFLLEKAIEKILTTEFPAEYVSRYQLVTFTRTPYSVAMNAGKIEDEILSQLSKEIKNPGDVNLELAKKLISQKLSPYLSSFIRQ